MNAAYDVIIIGTGAGAGTLAYQPAPPGKRVLLLERGDWLPREQENWSTAHQAGTCRVGDHLLERMGAKSTTATSV